MTAGVGLRVAVVCPYSLSRPGGVQGQVLGLAAALRRAGHQALVVAPAERPAGWASGPLYVAGRSVGVRANGSVAPVALSPAAAWRAVRAADAWGPDVVHVHEPLAPVLGWGFLLGERRPLVGTVHRAGASAAYRLVGPLARAAWRRLAACCAVSEEARQSAAALGGPCDVLFNGIDVDRFLGARPEPAPAPAVLFVGRHEPRKGLGVLLEAWALVGGPGVLWVAGEGPETAALRARHPGSERLVWLGRVDDGEVASRMAGATVLAAPSLGGESFGVVLLEAMAAGTAVVASDIPGYRAAASGHAVLVPPGDPVTLARAIEAVLAAPPGGAELAAARTHATGWSMDRLAAEYAARYRQAIAARGGAMVARR